MIAVFFRRSGPVVIIPLEECRTVTTEWYNEVCLSQAFGELYAIARGAAYVFTNITRPLTQLLGL